MSDEEIHPDDRPATVDELVSKWLSGEDISMSGAIVPPRADPEIAWQAVLRLLEQDLSMAQTSVLAAGPIESLLSWHGTRFIGRVEAEAQRNPAFAYLLAGVWRQGMSDEIWQRVQSVRHGNVW
jgi:hypothetical protein